MRLTLLSAGAAQSLVEAIAREDGIDLAGEFGAVAAMRDKFLGGEACDVVILTHAQMTELAAERRVSADHWADLGSVATGIAVRSGDPTPDISEPEALRATLRAADALYVPDSQKASAGRHFATVLETLGIQSEMLPRLNTYPGGAAAMRALAQSKARNPIGCTQASEILATPGVAYVGALPPDLELHTVYTAALSPRAATSLAASAFVERL
ncbi:MAG TPA: substrate-binding domain-containing protein, partial [Usitatibacter sp.]|nr:substrate-binding domain-containing protein [Usitatibacter sp.]